ncbi:uncharacterized protein [Clytia hemisphaerica]|uniref:THAP-type domain-containing protein n=2 Tax=Clytia hemisphaerica TaxID=252671 RepID=A0A7M5WHY0_9CNID
MTGANCCITGCSVNRKHKDISIFRIPALSQDIELLKWRRDFIRELRKYRLFDAAFKARLRKNTVHICARHFREDQLWHYVSKKQIREGELPSINLPDIIKPRSDEESDSFSSDEEWEMLPPRYCVICYKHVVEKPDRNLVAGHPNILFNVIDEIAVLPFDVPRRSEYICKKCKDLFQKRHKLRYQISEIDDQIYNFITKDEKGKEKATDKQNTDTQPNDEPKTEAEKLIDKIKRSGKDAQKINTENMHDYCQDKKATGTTSVHISKASIAASLKTTNNEKTNAIVNKVSSSTTNEDSSTTNTPIQCSAQSNKRKISLTELHQEIANKRQQQTIAPLPSVSALQPPKFEVPKFYRKKNPHRTPSPPPMETTPPSFPRIVDYRSLSYSNFITPVRIVSKTVNQPSVGGLIIAPKPTSQIIAPKIVNQVIASKPPETFNSKPITKAPSTAQVPSSKISNQTYFVPKIQQIVNTVAINKPQTSSNTTTPTTATSAKPKKHRHMMTQTNPLSMNDQKYPWLNDVGTNAYVVAKWPSSLKYKRCTRDTTSIAIALLRGVHADMARRIWNHEKLKSFILELLIKDIVKECDKYCHDKTPSILRKTYPEDFVHFTYEKLDAELKEHCPMLREIVRRVTTKRSGVPQEEKSFLSHTCMSISLIIKHRQPRMWALQKMLDMLEDGEKKGLPRCLLEQRYIFLPPDIGLPSPKQPSSENTGSEGPMPNGDIEMEEPNKAENRKIDKGLITVST